MVLGLSGVLSKELETYQAMSGRRLDMAPFFDATLSVQLTRNPITGEIGPVRGPNGMPIFYQGKSRTGRNKAIYDWTPYRGNTRPTQNFNEWYKFAEAEFQRTKDPSVFFPVKGNPSSRHVPDYSNLAQGDTLQPRPYTLEVTDPTPSGTGRTRAPGWESVGIEPREGSSGSPTLDEIRANSEPLTDDWWETPEVTADTAGEFRPDEVEEPRVQPDEPRVRPTEPALDLSDEKGSGGLRSGRPRAYGDPATFQARSPSGATQFFPGSEAFRSPAEAQRVQRAGGSLGRKSAIVAGAGVIGGMGLGFVLDRMMQDRRSPVPEEDDAIEMGMSRFNMASPEIESLYQDEANRIFDNLLGPSRESLQTDIDSISNELRGALDPEQKRSLEVARYRLIDKLRISSRNWQNVPAHLTDEDAIALAWARAHNEAVQNVDARIAAEQVPVEPESLRSRQARTTTAPPVDAPPAPETRSGPRFRGWKATTVGTVGGLGLGLVMGKMLSYHQQERRKDMAPIDPFPERPYRAGTSNPGPRTELWNQAFSERGITPSFTPEEVEAIQREWMNQAIGKTGKGDVLARARAIGEKAEKARLDEMDRTVLKPLEGNRVRPGDPALQAQFRERFGRYYPPAMTDARYAALTPFLTTYGSDRDALENLARQYGLSDTEIEKSRQTQLKRPVSKAASIARPKLNSKSVERIANSMTADGPSARFSPDTLAAVWAASPDYVEGEDIPVTWRTLEISERGDRHRRAYITTSQNNRISNWERSLQMHRDSVPRYESRIEEAQQNLASSKERFDALDNAPRGQKAGLTAAKQWMDDAEFELAQRQGDMEEHHLRMAEVERNDPRPEIELEHQRERGREIAKTMQQAGAGPVTDTRAGDDIRLDEPDAPPPERTRAPEPDSVPEPERTPRSPGKASDADIKVGPSSSGTRVGKEWQVTVVRDGILEDVRLANTEEEANLIAEQLARASEPPVGTYLSSGDQLLDDGRILSVEGRMLEPHEIEWKKVIAESVDPGYIDDDAPEPLRRWRDEVLQAADDTPQVADDLPLQRRPGQNRAQGRNRRTYHRGLGFGFSSRGRIGAAARWCG